ncbi:MAG TPA: transglycosylase SLT domain-containing protein [Candidatus Acidoferrales bacterium]|nr:transglycosylase SLT domain-containing protein [Candidatus Acidoferrales bacterium]
MRALASLLCVTLSLAGFPTPLFSQAPNQGDSFAKAYSLYSDGKFSQARGLFQLSIDSKFPLADYSLFYLADMAFQEKDWDGARQFLRQLKRRYPKSIWRQPAELQRAKIDLAENKYSQATATLRALRSEKAVRNDIAQEALFLLAQAAQEDPGQSYSLYQELRNTYPTSRWDPLARKEQSRLRDQYPEVFGFNTVQMISDEADCLSRERDYEGAEILYKKLLNNIEDPDARLRLLGKLSDLYVAARKRNEAIPVLQRIARDYSDMPEAPKALYQIGQILWNRHDNLQALEYFKQLLERYPASPFADKAQYASADIYEWQGKADEAIDLYNKAAASAGGEVRDDALWRLAWLYYRLGPLPDAVAGFKTLADQTKDSARRTAALYWESRSAEKNGDVELAKQLYRQVLTAGEESYYQALAARALARLGETIAEPKPIQVSIAPDPSSKIGPHIAFHLTRARELSKLALSQLANGELDEIARTLGKQTRLRPLLMREYFKNHAYGRSLALANQLPASYMDRNIYRFPLAYWDSIQQKAQDSGMDPYLILALIRQESLFDARARSPAFALGLMQLLPSTASRLAKQIGMAPPSNDQLFDPDINLTLGAQYLKQLLDRYSNNWFKAIAAYNAGEGAVDRWEKEIATDDIEEFVERIPYTETRGYVKLVLRNHRIYQKLYERSK